jgi:tetratricopeptide (TPR) repeat protein
VDRSPSQPLSAKVRRIIIALIAVAITVFSRGAVAQSADSIAIHGTVVDASHKPVADAAVKLEQKGAPGVLETKTNSAGTFTFPAPHTGTYTLTAEKSGLRSRAMTITATSQADQKSIDLVLEPASTSADMAFADQPNFTVAGIIDRTAAAGHGSDTSLRTSESLARDAATLKPDAPAAPIDTKEEASLRAALAASPGSFDANRRLGEFCLRAGSYYEAIPLLEAAFQIQPANRANEYDLALAQKGAGDYGAARVHAQNLLAHQNTADLHSLLGDLDEQTGDSLAAVREYELAVRLDASEPHYFKWGSELLLHRAVEPSIEVFTKGAEAHPKSARMLAALGAALFAAGRYEAAARRLCAASDLNPADTSPYIFLGRIDAIALWRRQNASADPRDLEPVETLLTKAVSLDPKYGEAYLQLGVLYFTEENYQKAIGFYTKAAEVNPQLSEAHYRLGVAYERTGEPAKAKEQFRLHAELEKQQAKAVEQQRRELKQFMVVLGQQPAHPSAN